jgi:hypothetical protein
LGGYLLKKLLEGLLKKRLGRLKKLEGLKKKD